MQLFITDFQVKQNHITIENPEILNQVRKVLRLEKGDHVCVQHEGIRYEIEITDRTDKTLTGSIISSKTSQPSSKEGLIGMIIGMPNKRDKIEMIVQKLTEIGLDEIIFRPSERSVIKERNENKAERLQKIAREAAEQSRGSALPRIIFVKNISEFVAGKNIVAFDFERKNNVTLSEAKGILETNSVSDSSLRSEGQTQTFGLVGPEGGLTDRDYQELQEANMSFRELGETVLRTETAAIIGGWVLKNA